MDFLRDIPRLNYHPITVPREHDLLIKPKLNCSALAFVQQMMNPILLLSGRYSLFVKSVSSAVILIISQHVRIRVFWALITGPISADD